jgi:L-rhamnose mutarotase
MLRKAFIMTVHPGRETEYEHRHRSIWPELEEVLKRHGAHNYSIFSHSPTNQLFAYVEIEDEKRWQAIAEPEVCQRWWASMHELMPSHADNRPLSEEIREVFHLD